MLSITNQPRTETPGDNPAGDECAATGRGLVFGKPSSPSGTGARGIQGTGHEVAHDVSSDAATSEPGGRFARTAEQFRLIRSRLLILKPSPIVIVVSSPVVGDGKTLASIYLAESLAAPNGERVLLIDADMRRPSVHSRLGMPLGSGLQGVLSKQVDVEQAIVQRPGPGNLAVLPAGEPIAEPAALLGSPLWTELIVRLRRRFSRIVIDTPPVHGLSDYPLITQAADGVVLVCRIDHTSRPALAESIRVTGSKLLGVVMNGMTEEVLCKTPGISYYGYASQQPERKP